MTTVLIPVGISIQRQAHSHLAKTRLTAWKIWSCPIFKEQDQKVKLKAFIKQADKRKLTVLVLVVFILIATLCWEQWVASSIFSLSRRTSLFN